MKEIPARWVELASLLREFVVATERARMSLADARLSRRLANPDEEIGDAQFEAFLAGAFSAH